MRATLAAIVASVFALAGCIEAPDAAVPAGGASPEASPIEVPSQVAAVDITLDRVAGDGPPDVDMVLSDADGEVIAHAAGSAVHEASRLRAANPALAPAPGNSGSMPARRKARKPAWVSHSTIAPSEPAHIS